MLRDENRKKTIQLRKWLKKNINYKNEDQI